MLYIPEIRHTFLDWPDDTATYGAHIIYLPGCDFHCKGCHNKELKKPVDWSSFTLVDNLEHLYHNSPIRHVILSGGDPLSKSNISGVKYLVTALFLLTDYKITIYTGHNPDQIPSWVLHECTNVSYVKCGQYVESLKQESGHNGNQFILASKNQVLIDGQGIVLSHDGIYNKGVINV